MFQGTKTNSSWFPGYLCSRARQSLEIYSGKYVVLPSSKSGRRGGVAHPHLETPTVFHSHYRAPSIFIPLRIGT